MNRKLHNSISALMAAGGALVLGLVIALPSPAPAASAAPELALLAGDAPATRPVQVELGGIKARISFDRDFVARARSRHTDVATVARRIEASADRLGQDASVAEVSLFVAGVAGEVADLTAIANAVDPLVAAEPASTETKRKAGTAARRNRRNLVMPYFSFLPRG